MVGKFPWVVNRICCIVLLLYVWGGGEGLHADDYVKYVRRMYGVEAGTACLMDFRFGQVVLRQWERDSILLESSFQVKHVEEWEKEGLAERLEFRLDAWRGVWKLYLEVAPDFGREGDLVAEIKVWVPRNLVLDVVNRYGNISLPNYDARLPLSLTTIYGDINVDTVRSSPDAEVRLNVSFGKLEIKNCEKATIRSSYSSVGIKSARYVQIKAEKSTLLLSNTDTILSDGEYNRYRID